MTAITVICIIALILALLLFIPAKLEFYFVWNEYERKFSLKFRYTFFEKDLIGQNKTKEKKTEKKKEKKYKFNDVIESVKRYKSIYDEVKEDVFILLKFAKKHSVIIKNLNVKVDFDTPDPMNTGILTGGVNAFVYNLISTIDRSMNLKKWNVDVKPLFENRAYFDILLSGIMTFKNAHIILIIFRAFPILLKVRKADKKYKSTQNKTL